MIEATAWNNGQHHRTGAGYGIKISAADRDRYFKRVWGTVRLFIPGANIPIAVNIDKASFWNDSCRELISVALGRWMISTHLAPWPKGQPPKFQLVPKGLAAFEIGTSSIGKS